MTTPEDDERTVLKSTLDPRVSAGALARLPGEFADALPPGTRLNEFEIVSVIGQGGFGIVYLAHDLSLDRRVAIKEYMPSALATRTQAMTVAVRSSRHTETFAAGLRSFVNEARLLARFDHPSLLKVHRFWEAHGTAYMVMPYYAGVTLAQQLGEPGGRPDEARLRTLLDPLLDALSQLHAARCYHRDIAPDNILMLFDGTPLLLDFGAARRVIGNLAPALTVILKSGYAPVEQYGEMPELSQGPWTDLYALGSVVEFAITGHTPPQAVARFLGDKRQPLAITAAGRYGDAFLRAIDRSLAVLPKDRPQSVEEMRALLAQPPSVGRGGTGRVGSIHVPLGSRRPDAIRTTSATAPKRRVAMAWAGSITLLVAVPVVVVLTERKPAPSQTERAPAARPAPADATPPAPQAPAAASVAPSGASLISPSTSTSPSPAPAPSPTALPESEPRPPPVPSPIARTEGQPAAPMPEVARPRQRGSLPSAREPTPSVSVTAPRAGAPRASHKATLSEACADIIQRVSLGEPLSNTEKSILERDCKP